MSFPEIILLRHSTTHNSLKNIISGWRDDKLNFELARIEIEYLLNKTKRNSLKPKIFDNAHTLFTSNLSRTKDTANILIEFINNKPRNIIETDLLKEKDYGILTNKCRNDLNRMYGKEQVRLWRRGYNEAPPEGESMKDVYDRVQTFYDMYFNETLKKISHFPNNNNKIIIISHGTPIRCLMSMIENTREDYYQLEEIPLSQGFYYKTTFDGRIIEKRSLPYYESLNNNFIVNTDHINKDHVNNYKKKSVISNLEKKLSSSI